MSIPVLRAAQPLEVAAVYDKVYVAEVVITADPQADVSARVRLRRFRTVGGQVEFAPEPPMWLEVDNLLSRAESDSALANVIGGLMQCIATIGAESGIIAAA